MPMVAISQGVTEKSIFSEWIITKKYLWTYPEDAHPTFAIFLVAHTERWYPGLQFPKCYSIGE